MNAKIPYKRLLPLLFGGAVALFVAYVGGGFRAGGKQVCTAFSDGCTVAAVLLLGGCALRFCTRLGAFDGLAFALSSAFRKREGRESYYDYRARKENARPKSGGSVALYAGAAFLVLALIFLGFAV